MNKFPNYAGYPHDLIMYFPKFQNFYKISKFSKNFKISKNFKKFQNFKKIKHFHKISKISQDLKIFKNNYSIPFWSILGFVDLKIYIDLELHPRSIYTVGQKLSTT